MDNERITDLELDVMLKAAQQPALPQGFADRLQARLERPATADVLAFPQIRQAVGASATASQRLWLSAIPLAASLAVGLYWGAMGALPDSLAGLDVSLVSDSGDALFNIGIEDTESFINGDFS